MKVHILQHVPFEDIGSMASWLEVHDAEVSYTRFFDNLAFTPPRGIDLLIAMGGPMSVNDESSLTWLRPEKQFVRECISRGIAILGVCFGAQLIASVLGAPVYQNSQKEIGWFPIEATSRAIETFNFPPRARVFHWHGETFDLPSGSVHLAKSAACENQAFQIGRHIIGLQFHLETIPESVRALLDNCNNDLAPGPYVQTESELREVPSAVYAEINSLMSEVLSYLMNTPN